MSTLSRHQLRTSTAPRGWVPAGRLLGRQGLPGIRERIRRFHEDFMKWSVSPGVALRRWPEPETNQRL